MSLSPSNIPIELRPLLPLAEKYGVADDSERERLVREASPAELRELRATIQTHDDALDAWLAGPESFGPVYSDEYIAFSAMRMAADCAPLPRQT